MGGKSPFKRDDHHEENADHHSKMMNVHECKTDPGITELLHQHDHAADLDEVRYKKVDDVDWSNVVLTHLENSEKLLLTSNVLQL